MGMGNGRKKAACFPPATATERSACAVRCRWEAVESCTIYRAWVRRYPTGHDVLPARPRRRSSPAVAKPGRDLEQAHDWAARRLRTRLDHVPVPVLLGRFEPCELVQGSEK